MDIQLRKYACFRRRGQIMLIQYAAPVAQGGVHLLRPARPPIDTAAETLLINGAERNAD